MPTILPTLSRRGLLTAGAAAAAAGTAGLAGCGRPSGGSLGDGTGHLTVWTWPDNDQMFAQTIPIFEKHHPGITVSVQGFQGGDAYLGKVLGALVSGTGPDVAMIEITYISSFKGKPGFVDLSKAPFHAGRLASGYARSQWGYVVDDVRDTVFALPKNAAPGGMFYRRDTFAKGGLPTDPDEVHAAMPTWDAFVSEGRKLRARDSSAWLCGSPLDIVNARRLQDGVWCFDADGHPRLDDPKFAEYAEFALRLKAEKLLAPQLSSQENGAAMADGRLAALFNGNWMGGQLKNIYAPAAKGKWGVAFAPAGPGGDSAFSQGGDFMAVLESSRNQAAAWEFIRWVTQSDESLKAMYGRDLYPAWLPALTRPWLNVRDPYYAGENVNSVFSEVSKKLRPPVTNKADNLANQALGSALQSIVFGGSPVRSTLRGAQSDLEGALR